MWWVFACARPVDDSARARLAVERGVAWLEANPHGARLRIDAAIGLSAIGSRLPSPAAAALDARLRPEVDRAGDPRRRLYDGTARLPERPPPATDARSNALLVEALYCAEHPLRAEVVDLVCGPLRDGGGYGSAHAAWILAEALDRGCVAREATCADALLAELVEAPIPALAATLDRDLLAERVLFGLRIGAEPAAVAPAADALLAAQAEDGGFGVPHEGEDPWWAYHATLAAAWGLSEWVARREGR